MNRREAIRLLAAGSAMPLLPHGMLAMMREARTVVGTETTLRSLNSHQEAIVRMMAEMILPRTETPGANDVGACEFIDLILTEWCDESERGRFLAGLADVDSRAQALSGKEFVACSAQQREEILTELGKEIAATAEPAHGPRPARGDWSSRANEHFYPMLRRLTLTAYYTSESGMTEVLHYEIIPDHHDACAPAQSALEAPKPE
jgi:gluconate 2-dehydrogenase gamma chain